MRKYLALFIICMLVVPAFGAGRSMMNGRDSSRATMVTNQLMPTLPAIQVGVGSNSVVPAGNPEANAESGTANVVEPQPVVVVNRDAEKAACVSNNIGVGNTFVWASKNSNISNYASMVEDVNNPENNVCFVLVGMRSDDSKVSVSDVQPRYFQWGQNITCGNWVDETKMEQRILDAKKTGRTLATVGGAVGGVAVGVGAMELFGNKLIGGAVQGQKQYEEGSTDWYQAKANELKQTDEAKYKEFVELVKQLQGVCNNPSSDQKCNRAPYASLRSMSF